MLICKTHSLKTSVYSCLQTGGVHSFRYIQTKAINWSFLNQNIDFFFDKNTFEIKNALPLLRLAGSEGWAYCEHNFSDAERTAVAGLKEFWDVNLKNITLNGHQDTRKLQEIKSVCEMVLVSKMHDGLVLIDGIDYDYYNNTMSPTQLVQARLSETEETSGVWDSSEFLLKMNFSCRQRQKGFKGLFDFYDMNQFYDAPNTVFSTTDDSIFITSDNSVFTL